jgi:RNA polymerase sigma-70 factor, ECF subfamily
MNDSDARLVERIRTGDPAAFETLMRRHFRMAFIIAFAHLQNRTDAEDVCQDAFFRCWQRIEECREPARVAAWIAAVVRTVALNRRESLRLRATEAIEAAQRIPSSQRTDGGAVRAELRDRLESALRQLLPTRREVLLLHDLEGWKHAEIAERLDISELMSRRHLSDARKRMRELLGDAPMWRVNHD